MRNIIGPAVIGDDLHGRDYELDRLWEHLGQGEHIQMLAPRRVGKTSLMLELHRAPRANWDVIYVDVEGGDGPADCVASILAGLAADPKYQTRFEAMPFSKGVRDLLKGVSVGASISVLHLELKRAIGSDWGHAADQLEARLTSLDDPGDKLLIILDELPILISRMLRHDRKHEAELLLARLRHWRQAPALRNKVHTLIGGSIGLEGILRRTGLSGLINDLVPFQLNSWDRPTAVQFLEELTRNYNFSLDGGSIARILDLLDDPVPYHVQLFFSALRDASRADPSCVSPELIDQCFEERLSGPSGTAHLDHYEKRLEIALDEGECRMAYNILGRACQGKDGVAFADLEDLRQGSETFQSVLGDLEADGYLKREDRCLLFRSNLLRAWWRKHHGRDSAR